MAEPRYPVWRQDGSALVDGFVRTRWTTRLDHAWYRVVLLERDEHWSIVLHRVGNGDPVVDQWLGANRRLHDDLSYVMGHLEELVMEDRL